MASGDGSKEVKAALKKAKEALKAKDYQLALEHSQTVLSHEPNHYHALVFVGKCFTELGQTDEANQAYQKAIKEDSGQLLAWQGLCSLYEKVDSKANRENLVEVYQHLMKLLGDETKEKQVAEKLARLYEKLGRHVEACSTLLTLMTTPEDDAENLASWVNIVELLCKVQPLDQQNSDLLKKGFMIVLESSGVEGDRKQKFYKDYINFLLKMNSVEVAELKTACSKMHDQYPTDAYPMEKLAEIVLIETYGLSSSVDWSVFDDLHSLDSSNVWALTGQAQLKIAARDFKAASDLLGRATMKLAGFPVGWLLLAKSQLSLHGNKAVKQSTKQGLKSLKTYQHPAMDGDRARRLKEEFLTLQCQASVDSGLKDEASKVITLIKELLPEAGNKACLLQITTEAYLILGDISSAAQSFDEIAANDRDSSDAIALDGWLKLHQEKLDEAEERLKCALGKCEKAKYHYRLGRTYWAMGGQVVQDKAKCLSSFLKAAKLDPNYSDNFLYLGHYYMQIGKDPNKAKRCYRKAYDLNPSSEGSAVSLGNVCDLLDEKEEAIELYAAVTNQAASGGAKWAWLRLGLAQLRAGKATEAVESFQAVLRADPDDKHCQECLAEAYLSRGSYTAALKAFSRVVEMDPNATYSLFKIGFIKQNLGLHTEAIADYQAILSQTPDYVPALSGQGETYLLLARAALYEFFNVRAVSHVQNAITVLSKAIILRPDLCGVWKLLGDACTLLAPLHEDIVRLSVDGALLSRKQGTLEEIGKGELLALGGRCYSRAVQRQKDCASLWHDLAINYLRQHQWSREDKLAYKAMQFIKKAITLDKTNHVHWTALGVIAASQAISDCGLAQHAFIKSIQLEAKNVVAWTNLGALYLSQENMKLAHEAFKVAQSLEPNYVQCWIGQSLIAETMGSEEAMDLFRHTTELATHVEGGQGYADLVCRILLDHGPNKDSEIYRYNIAQMSAIPVATAAIGKVSDQTDGSLEAHTLHGVLLERQGLHRAAEIPYRKAVESAKNRGNQADINIALSNHGRALSAIGQIDEAIEQIRSITPLTELQDILTLGLALYRKKDWAESYMAYDQALQLASSEAQQSQILTAMAMVSYHSGDLNNAKTLLFKCSQSTTPCEQGLLALCALGLKTQDLVLANAALAEIAKLPTTQELVHRTVVLTAAIHFMQGDIAAACEHVTLSVTKYPFDTKLWSLAAELLLLLDPTNPLVVKTNSEVCKKMIPTHKNVLEVNAAAELSCGNHGNSSDHRVSPCLREAQKAVHAMPGDVNNWALLGACCSAQLSWQQVHQHQTALEETNILIARFLLQLSKADSKLAGWVSLHTVFSMLQTHQWEEARNLSKQLLEWCDYGGEANSNLLLLNKLSHWMETKKRAGLEPIRDAVTQTQSSLSWQTLGKIYSESGMASAAEACYKQCLQLTSGRRQTTIIQQLADLAIMGLKTGDTETWSGLAEQTLEELSNQTPAQPITHLLKALLYRHLGKQEKQIKKELQRGLNSEEGSVSTDVYTRSVLTNLLDEVLDKKDKDAAKAVVQEVVVQEDPFMS